MSRSHERLLPPGRAGIEARVERAGVLLDELELISESFLAEQQRLVVEAQEGTDVSGSIRGRRGWLLPNSQSGQVRSRTTCAPVSITSSGNW